MKQRYKTLLIALIVAIIITWTTTGQASSAQVHLETIPRPGFPEPYQEPCDRVWATNTYTTCREQLSIKPPISDMAIIGPNPFPGSVQAEVKAKLEWLLNGLNDPFATQYGESYYQMIALSSGNLYVVELDEYSLDVLDIYLIMYPGPIRVPLIVGFMDTRGAYTSLVVVKQDIGRDELLEHVVDTYPRWKESTIMLTGNFVMGTRSVDWEKCTDYQPAFRLTLNGYCTVGKLLEDAYAVEMQLLRAQELNLDRIPEDFILPWFLLPPH